MRCLSSVAILAILGLAAACGGDSSTSSTQSIAGTWSLQTLNGQALPYVLAQSGSAKVELTGDVYTITNNGAFTQLTTERITQNGQVSTATQPDAGSYTVNGSTITFYYSSNGTNATGSWSGNTLTIAGNGVSGVFTR